jgi:hypothetical protein
MSEPKPAPDAGSAQEEDEGESAAQAGAARISGPADLISPLKMQGDTEGLLKLAKQFRSGAGGAKRDLAACFEAYRAAAELGSAVAQHAVGLFYLNGGGGIERSERDAALQFRAAADQGHLPSKVLVGNFYELGVHYRADAAKADVWYRNVARSAEIEAEAESKEYARALADLGCVRYCLSIVEAADTSEEDRARFLRVAKTYGFRPDDGGRITMTAESAAPLEAVEAEAEAISQRGGAAKVEAKSAPKSQAASKAEAEPAPKKKTSAQSKVNVGLASTGFFLTLLFMAIGVVLGHVLRHGAVEQVAAGQPVPVFGMNAEAVLPAFVVALGVLPNLLFYRLAAFAKAFLIGGASVIGGEILWGMGKHFFSSHVMQLTDFGVAGMLAGLLAFGLFGGVKPGSR